MKTYPKLRYPGDETTEGLFAAGEVSIQEKLDGFNFRFTYDGELTFGSRRTWGDHLNTDQFADAIEYIDMCADRGALAIQREDYGDLLYFGEAMNPHTIGYDWDETPDFIGFDVWSIEEEMFLPTETVYELFDNLGLPTTPLIDTIGAADWDDYDFEVPDSAFYDGKAEGVVFKNHDTGVYAKFVREDFKEKHGQTFGKSKKLQTSGAEKMAYQYVTHARIRKAAHRLIEEGEYNALQMEMMRHLPETVIRDMADEEAGTIFMSENWEIDTGEFRSIISSRCASVLRNMINQQIKESL